MSFVFRQFLMRFAALITGFVIVNASEPEAASIPSADIIGEPYLFFLQASKQGDTTFRYGTGVLIFHYLSEDTICLMTAHHCLRERDKLQLSHQGPQGGLEAVLDSAIDLQDETGNPLYWTSQIDSATVPDFALLPLPLSCFSTKRALALSRSVCVFGDSIDPGDHMVVFGFPSVETFPFVRKGNFMALSATVAYVSASENAFLLDRELHQGMSGGIVFLEVPVMGSYAYRVAGIVSRKYSKYPDYSVIINLNYVDSIYFSKTGSLWGESSADTGE